MDGDFELKMSIVKNIIKINREIYIDETKNLYSYK